MRQRQIREMEAMLKARDGVALLTGVEVADSDFSNEFILILDGRRYSVVVTELKEMVK